uniref:Transmembrane protein 230 n=1 Tax=Panagrolaimus sp. PS1159 TaxID=55785 RepID=A0AC35FXC4_9BILA
MSRRKNNYKHLEDEDEDDSRGDQSFNKFQFQEKTDIEIPWKGILLAFALTVIGFGLILFSFSSYRLKDTSDDFQFPSLILGCIAFIPGSYHLWIAYHSYKKTPGYNFDDIPNFD